MISAEEYRKIISDLMEELPDEFFRELSGGVVVSEGLSIPDYARGNDLYILGKYQIFSRIRQITMYKGSFDRVYPHADADQAREILRGVLRHEMRHHLESLGGIHDASSLEAEDEQKKQAYLARHASEKNDRQKGIGTVTDKKPEYLYNPALCPCPRGEKANCPRYKQCDACIAFHRTEGNPPQTACEKKAGITGSK